MQERDGELKKPTQHEVALARQAAESEARMILMKDAFQGVNWLVRVCHETAKKHGWWDPYDRFFDEHLDTVHADLANDIIASKLALIHSEVSEALEELRRHPFDSLYYKQSDETDTKKPEGMAAELADVLIRIFDLCGRYHIPLSKALKEKMAYNEKRPYRHGGKKL